VTVRIAGKSSWIGPLSALAVAVCVLTAVIGYGLARADHAISGAPNPPTASVIGTSVSDERLDHHIENASLSTTHTALHLAVLHRTRPSVWSSSVQFPWSSPALGTAPALWPQLGVPGSGAPGSSLAGRERLTHLCVARR
jgi:hypothetical protein